MLILSRRPGESITIDGDIEVEILEIHSNQVRIGIHAPDEVEVVRSELIDTDESPD